MSSIGRHLTLSALLMTLVRPAMAAQAMDLHILPEGQVRIDNGPVMSLRQFRARLDSLKKLRNPPDLVTRTDSDVPFASVVVVMQVVQDADYNAHLKVPEPGPGK